MAPSGGDHAAGAEGAGLSPVALLRFVEEGPVGFVATDERDLIVAVNTTLCTWLGRDAASLIGTTSLQDLLTAGDRIYYDTHIRPLLHLQDELHEVAVELLAVDRTRVPVMLNSVRRADESGRIRTEIAVFDARERTRYERELLRERKGVERSEARLQLFYDVAAGMAKASTVDEILDVVASRGAQWPDDLGCTAWVFGRDEVSVTRVGTGTSGSGLPTRLDWDEAANTRAELAAGRTIVVDDIDDPHHADRFPLVHRWLTEVGWRSAIVAPLNTSSGLVGVLIYGAADLQSFDTNERRDVESLALQTAEALRRAELHELDIVARRTAELLGEFSADLNRAVTLEEVAAAITAGGLAAFGAAAIALLMVDEDGELVVGGLVSTSAQRERDLAAAVRLSPEVAVARTALQGQQPSFVEGLAEVHDLLGSWGADLRFGAVAVLPLVDAGESLGLLVALFESNHIPAPIRATLRGASAEISVSIGRTRRHDADRRTAMALQQAMLPPALESAGNWEIDVHYAAGTENLLVGGDLYDVTRLPDGRMSLVVADVVGHGLVAASAMGQLRSGAKMLALQGLAPADVLLGLDSFAALTPGARHASVCCVSVTDTGRCTYAAAGHPYPLLVDPDGAAEFLTEGRWSLLGVRHSSAPTEATILLRPRSSLVLYTDGLVERRGESLDEGMARLRDCVSDHVGGGQPAKSIASDMVDVSSVEDDVVVLVATYLGEGPSSD